MKDSLTIVRVVIYDEFYDIVRNLSYIFEENLGHPTMDACKGVRNDWTSVT